MNFTLETVSEDKKIQRIETHSIRVFYTEIRSINWQDCLSIKLRVSYGVFKDSSKKYQTFFNEGTYKNKEDFFHALNAFLDV